MPAVRGVLPFLYAFLSVVFVAGCGSERELDDAGCRSFPVTECPEECFVRPDQPYDEERGCYLNEIVEACVKTLVMIDIELPICDSD
ncbi:MAG: hypothetical protein AAGF92_24175 [Myxococcota bacterium]